MEIFELVKVHDPKLHGRPVLMAKKDFDPTKHTLWVEGDECVREPLAKVVEFKAPQPAEAVTASPTDESPVVPIRKATARVSKFKKRTEYPGGVDANSSADSDKGKVSQLQAVAGEEADPVGDDNR